MSGEALFATYGRFHPMVLHLPIGLVFALIAVEVLALVRRTSVPPQVRATLAWLAAGAAVVSATSGYVLGLEPGYEGETVDLHRYLGIGVAIAALMAALLQRRGIANKWYAGVLAVCAALLLPAGHLGATMTHGENFLFAHLDGAGAAPVTRANTRADTRANGRGNAADAPQDAAVLDPTYKSVIAPIFADRCLSCHGRSTQKGGLALNSPQGILKGSDSGVIILSGDPANSELIRRLRLPADDTDHMPPPKKKQLTQAEIGEIEAWVTRGAPMVLPAEGNAAANLAAAPTTGELSAGAESSAPSGTVSTPQPDPTAAATGDGSVAQVVIDPPGDDALRAFAAKHIYVGSASPGTGLLLIDFAAAPRTITDEEVAALLAGARAQASDVTVARMPIGQRTAKVLSDMPNLSRLNASASDLRPADLALLAHHAALSELVLSQTRLDDSVADLLASTESFPALKRVFLWKSGIGAGAIERLAHARPNLAINTGEKIAATPLVTEDKPVFTSDRPPFAAAAAPLAASNTVCPVSGKPVDPRYVILYEGKLIGFCCEKCGAAFWEDPKKYPAK